MDNKAAVRQLRRLADEVRYRTQIGVAERAEAAGLVAGYLGADSGLVAQIEALTVSGMMSSPSGIAEHLRSLESGGSLRGLLLAAAAIVEARSVDPVPATPACDPDLWRDIGGLVTAQQWHVIPGRTVTFTESWFRTAAGNPVSKRGERAYGKVMFQQILHPDSEFALGATVSEREGWRNLAVGLVQAVGNDHRHAVRRESEAERTAWGVIGTASLLIGEFRRSHLAVG